MTRRGDAYTPQPDPAPGYPAHGLFCGVCGLPTLAVFGAGRPQGWAVGCPRCSSGVRQLEFRLAS